MKNLTRSLEDIKFYMRKHYYEKLYFLFPQTPYCDVYNLWELPTLELKWAFQDLAEIHRYGCSSQSMYIGDLIRERLIQHIDGRRKL